MRAPEPSRLPERPAASGQVGAQRSASAARRGRTAAAVVIVVLSACSGTGEPPAALTASAPPPPVVPSTAPSAAAAPSAASTGASEGGVVLGGVDLGVTRLGRPFRDAVAAVSTVLGTPTADPADDVTCVLSASEVAWEGFRLAESTEGGTLAGWVSTSQTLFTPSGVSVGTDLATLRQVYGAALRLFPSNPDGPSGFELTTADVGGDLSDETAVATVTSVFNGFCSGP